MGRTIGDPDTSSQLLPADAFSFIQSTELAGTLGRNTFRKGGIANPTVIPDAEGIAFPVSADIYHEVYGPADIRELANTVGLPMYAYDYEPSNSPSSPLMIESQSRPLSWVTRPQLLVKVTNT